MQKTITKGIKMLLDWGSDEAGGSMKAINRFYSILQEERTKKQIDRNDPIGGYGIYLENCEKMFSTILDQLGSAGLVEFLVYLFDNDNRYNNTDTILNYKEFKPYPSYIIIFAYTLIAMLPKGLRTRKLFNSFWEHQAKIRPGLDEQFAKAYIKPFIEEGITTKEEIRNLLIRDQSTRKVYGK